MCGPEVDSVDVTSGTVAANTIFHNPDDAVFECRTVASEVL
jgi:hypothetical protein